MPRDSTEILFVTASLALACAVCVFCWLRGGPAERRGAAFILSTWAIVSLTQLATGQNWPPVTLVLADFVLGLGFLYLALRYSNLWLGAAMMLQGAALALNLFFSPEGRGQGVLHALLVNLISFLVLGVIFLAAVFHRRRKEADEGPERRAVAGV